MTDTEQIQVNDDYKFTDLVVYSLKKIHIKLITILII